MEINDVKDVKEVTEFVDKNKPIKINVLTPSRVIWTEVAYEILLPSLTGDVGVLWNHATLVTALETGLMRIKHEVTLKETDEEKENENENKEEKRIMIWSTIIACGGLAEIDRNRVTVLLNDVQEILFVDVSETKKRLEKAILTVEEIGIIDEENEDHMKKVNEVKIARSLLSAIEFLPKSKIKEE